MPDSEMVHVASGKVRELYELDADRLLFVASDRISTFDVVLPSGIPDKGKVLTGLSAFWFSRTKHIARNHLRSLREDGRSMEVARLRMLPIECVVRGYVAGSAWKDYQVDGETSGHRLPTGLLESQRLPEPIFTPATKAQRGHDENISREQAANMVGHEIFGEVERLSIELYQFASEHALGRKIILADTKLEFGLDGNNSLVLADEVFTPDSSRFWPADQYEPGRGQFSFDKQYVRNYCESVDWDKEQPGPQLPRDVIDNTQDRYIQAFELLTEILFDDYAVDPEVVLK